MADEAIQDVLCLRSELDSLERPKPYLVTNLGVRGVPMKGGKAAAGGGKQGEHIE
jgi:hypothetical protein